MRGFFSLLLASLLALCVGCADSVEPTPAAFSGAVDQCLGSSDSELIGERRIPDDGGVAVLPDEEPLPETIRYFEECARTDCYDHVFGDDIEALIECSNTCIDNTEVDTLSEGCRECYIEMVKCAIDVCLLECAGSSAELCDSCVAENCDARLGECIGF